MIKETITVDEVIGVLNSALALDPLAISTLVNRRAICNVQLGDHPTIQTGQIDQTGVYEVGMLGVINGLFGIDEDGYGPIAGVMDMSSKTIKHFIRTNVLPHPVRDK